MRSPILLVTLALQLGGADAREPTSPTPFLTLSIDGEVLMPGACVPAAGHGEVRRFLEDVGKRAQIQPAVIERCLRSARVEVAVLSETGRESPAVVVEASLPGFPTRAVAAFIETLGDYGLCDIATTQSGKGLISFPSGATLHYVITGEGLVAASASRLVDTLRHSRPRVGRSAEVAFSRIPRHGDDVASLMIDVTRAREALRLAGRHREASGALLKLAALCSFNSIGLGYDGQYLTLSRVGGGEESSLPRRQSAALFRMPLPGQFAGALVSEALSRARQSRGSRPPNRAMPLGHDACRHHLEGLGKLLVRHAGERGGAVAGGGPSGLRILQSIAEAYAREVPAGIFVCPLGRHVTPTRLPNGVLRITHRSTAYRARAREIALGDLRADNVLIYEARPFDGSGRWALCGDFKVRWMREDAFRRCAEEQNLFGLPPGLQHREGP